MNSAILTGQYNSSMPTKPDFGPRAQLIDAQQMMPEQFSNTQKAKNPASFEVGFFDIQFGGEGEIRTLDTVSCIHTFQACSLSHSDTSPYLCRHVLSVEAR